MTLRPERRARTRVQLPRGIVARFGAMPAVVLDISDAGARIEHFSGLQVGRRGRFRVTWRGKPVEVDATVVRCRVQRFGAGESGTTVYQSGLAFTSNRDESAGALRDLMAAHVARSIAEHVANARGVGPARDATPDADRGYFRCTLTGRHWDRKWSRTPDQPPDGFTVPATEPEDQINQLCDAYLRSSAADREFIRTLARVSVEQSR